MSYLQEKRRLKLLLQSRVLLAVLVISIILLLGANYDIYKKNEMASINRQESDRKLAVLKQKKDQLTLELQRLDTKEGVEEELRDKFQITKSGEEVLVVLNTDEGATDTASSTVDKGFWQKFKDFVGW